MANVVDLSLLASTLQTNQRVFSEIFRTRLAKLDPLRDDFIVLNLEADKEVNLVRSVLGNVTQPGKTGTVNWTSGAVQFKNKTASHNPIKIDLKFDEKEREALRTGFLSKIFGTSDSDLYTVTGADYIFSEIMAKSEQEQGDCIFNGVFNDTTGVVGGTNLFDGLGVQFTAAYASGEIPSANKSTTGANITTANFATELTKFENVIRNNRALYLEARQNGGVIYMPSTWAWNIMDGLEALTYKSEQIVKKNADGTLSLNKFPRITIKTPFWMDNASNMFYTANSNLFFLTHNLDMTNVQVEFQKQDRDLKFLADWFGAVNFADGRYIVLHK